MWKPWTILSAILITALPAWAEAPKVVVSVQPLHSIAASLMQGVAEPGLIVKGVQSEHGYALKPSDARMIAGADLVILVDEGYETFLKKPLKGRDGQTLAVADLPGATVLKPREGKDHGQGGHHHDHDHGSLDGHLWLDVGNARLLARTLADRLAKLDPAHHSAYTANLARLDQELDRLDQDLKSQLEPVRGKGFAVFHDAYHYFEDAYGLTQVGAITIDPDQPPSPKRLAALRDRLKASGAVCIFHEPQFPAAIVHDLAARTGIKVGQLDPQGADIPAGPAHYATLMRNLAQSLTSCLSAP